MTKAKIWLWLRRYGYLPVQDRQAELFRLLEEWERSGLPSEAELRAEGVACHPAAGILPEMGDATVQGRVPGRLSRIRRLVMHRWQHPRLVLATILCVAPLPACYNWDVPEIGPSQYIREEQPGVVRVTRVDGSSMDIVDPTMVDGSIVGVLGSRGRGRQMVDSTVSVPIDAATRVEVRRLSQLRTGVATTVIGAALLVTIGRVFSNWVHR